MRSWRGVGMCGRYLLDCEPVEEEERDDGRRQTLYAFTRAARPRLLVGQTHGPTFIPVRIRLGTGCVTRGTGRPARSTAATVLEYVCDRKIEDGRS